MNKDFDFSNFGDDLKTEIEKLAETDGIVKHTQIFILLLEQIQRIDFREKVKLTDVKEKLLRKHFLICASEEILKISKENNWGMCVENDFAYLYNGAFWNLVSKQQLEIFLGQGAEKMGVDKYDARHYLFREQLFKQFISTASLPSPSDSTDSVLVNLKNGTFEINPNKQYLRVPDRDDFLKYQLSFNYDPKAESPIFNAYLNTVLPDISRQMILSEYLGYLFIKPQTLKLEKTLLLFGTGANGKSVFFDIIYELLGKEQNVSNYSLQSLTNENGYSRAMLVNKLLNYASEINGSLETAVFKQLVSGEPVSARLPYGNPFTLNNYAKFIFNCNELPKDVEHSHAYFRRFLIIPFDVTIPDHEQDKELAKKIINTELSGVFNWILQGLNRLLVNKKFTDSDAVDKLLEKYKKESDSVQLFLEEEGYDKCETSTELIKNFYIIYTAYCRDSGYRQCSKKTFCDRLRKIGFHIERKSLGLTIYLKHVI